MNNLVLEFQGTQGKNKVTKNPIGLVQVSSNENMLIVDKFIGSGETYKEREKPVITLSSNGKDYFHGTFEELENRLKS